MKFDEFTIAEHDKDRGTRQKISEPKTPYEDAAHDEEVSGGSHDVEMKAASSHDHHHHSKHIDEEIKMHLEEAERNKMLNA